MSTRLATDYILENLTLINHEGIGVDIRPILEEMSINESVGNEGITGEIRVSDVHQNIREMLPFAGSEQIEISFRTNSPDYPSWEKTLHVVGIGDEVIVNDTKKIYTIFFISKLLFNNNVRISKAYNMTNSEIVKDILSNVVFDDDEKIYIENTKYSKNFIVPNWKPIKTINYLASKSISKEGFNDFYLFENREGVWFSSLSHIISSDDYYLSDTELTLGRADPLNSNPYRILGFQLEQLYNIETTQMKGGIANSLMTHDILKKEYNEDYISYPLEFYRYKDLEGTTGSEMLFSSESTTDANWNSEAKFNQATSNYFNSNINEQLMQRQIRINSWDQNKLNIQFGSNSEITIGKWINLNLNSWNQDSDTKDRQFDGPWLIYEVIHHFQGIAHSTAVKLRKDAFN